MTDIKTLDEILDNTHCGSCDSYGEEISSNIHRYDIKAAKQALNLYIKERERLARINEIEECLMHHYPYDEEENRGIGCVTCGGGKWPCWTVQISKDRIKELKG